MDRTMNTTVRRCAAIALLGSSVACGGSGPTSPTGIDQPAGVSAPTHKGSINFPPLSGPSRTFVFDGEVSYRVRDYTRNYRFVLSDYGAVVRPYPARHF